MKEISKEISKVETQYTVHIRNIQINPQSSGALYIIHIYVPCTARYPRTNLVFFRQPNAKESVHTTRNNSGSKTFTCWNESRRPWTSSSFLPIWSHSLSRYMNANMTQVGKTITSNSTKTITTKGASASTAKFIQRTSKLYLLQQKNDLYWKISKKQHSYAQVKSCPVTPRSTKKQILIRAVRTPSPNTVKVKES